MSIFDLVSGGNPEGGSSCGGDICLFDRYEDEECVGLNTFILKCFFLICIDVVR